MAADKILLFGDQADAPIPMIRRVLEKSRQSKNLELFLQTAIDHVQLEVAKLNAVERSTVGSFHSVQDLMTALTTKTDRLGIAQMVLVFIARIGELILHAESNPALLSSSTSVLSLGVCGGLIPAAAAAVATNVGELIEVAGYLAGVNCRVAAAISRRSLQIEDDEGSWAFSALGKVVGQLPSILEQFHKEQFIPQHRRAYIAISTPTWATIFGPPSVLQKLLASSSPLSKSDITILPAFGAVHAGHLVVPDLEELVSESALLSKPLKSSYKLLSGSKYAPFGGSTLKDLLPPIMLDIFQNSTNPSRVFEVGGSFLRKGKEISLYMLGTTSYLVLLRRSLHLQGFEVALKTNAPSLTIPELRGGSGSVAIVGMSGQFPGAANVDEMWETLMRREELHRKIPSDRFDADDYLDETGRGFNAITSAYGCFLEHPGLFDHKMFNVSPREAMKMDPGQRLLMHAVYEALEDAGVANNGTLATDSRRMGTYIGDGSDDWRELQQPHGVDKYILQGTQRSFTPGRINHHFKWEGATFCVDSACGSTASAVGLAYRALVDRDCDTAIAGGSNIIATPFWHSALSKGGFLSTTGGCKTFRGDADGYCRGEAIGVIVLKRLEDAIQDNDNIISVIRGYARNHSADTVSITRPHVPAQERVYRKVLSKAGIEANDISYVEMHGTGTTAGDSAELESVVNVLAQKGERENPLLVGAIKANLGHSEAASGISSIMKAAIMFRKGVIPPQVGIPENLGQFACLERGSVTIPGEPIPFTRQSVGQKRTMIVNNFDAAGGNSCFVLEEPPLPLSKTSDPRTHHTVTVSAHCPVSLDQNKRHMLQFLTDNDYVNLADLAYTTTSRRMHHSLRSAYSGNSIQDIIGGLTRDLSKDVQSEKTEESSVVFMFTGQGAHYAGMGADLYKTSPPFRATVNSLQRSCEAQGFPSFVELISDPKTAISDVTTAQIHMALVALEIALVDLWKVWGITPDVVVGHSIGEYAALYAAGVLSATDAMYLVGKRALLVQDSCQEGTHGMLSISGTTDDISAILANDNLMTTCELACYNSPSMIVLSGERLELSKFETFLKEKGIKCKLLDVPYGMHSRQMDVILPGLREAAQGVRFGTPKIPVASTLMGAVHSGFDTEYLVRHTREPVQFKQALSHCVSHGLVNSTTLWFEIGPNPVCLGLARSNTDIALSRALPSLKNGESNWRTVSAALSSAYKAGKSIRWREYHFDFVKYLSLLPLPKYAFDTRDFWMTYTEGQRITDGESRNASSKTHKDVEQISTSLHHLVRQDDNGQDQSATFTALVSQPSLLKMIQGHKLSGVIVCPAGVFSEMALTAARYLLTEGSSTAPFPPLSVLDTQIDHPIMPNSNPKQTIQVDISRPGRGDQFEVTIKEQSKPSVITSKCVVRLRDEQKFAVERQRLLETLQPKINALRKAAAGGLANRFQGKLFYKLFANVMDYAGQYEGIQDAIVSNDFTESIATVRLPKTQESYESSTLSPYWIDALTHLAGFLFNGNPMSTGDFVYMGTHMERMEIVAKDFSVDKTYQSYAYIEHPEGSDSYRGHVYILDGDYLIGFLKGARFRKVPRTTLHRILGKAEPSPPAKQAFKPSANGTANGTAHATANGITPVNGVNGTNGHMATSAPAVNGSTGSKDSLYSTLIKQLIEETGMEEGEVTESMFFNEIGVDSLMSISILAAIKTETGVELNASFLMDNPTLKDAKRELRILDSNNDSGAKDQQTAVNGNGLARDCNVVLMQGSPISEAGPALFLIADGAGSAAAYIHFPKLGRDLTVYAVESPWVNDPENFNYGFEEVADRYLAAVRAKQPRGPYMLGGWSAGGVFSYEVARRLLEAGEEVHDLFILDITGPRHEDRTKVTPPTMDIIDQIGMLSGIERNLDDELPQAKRLKRHMLSTVTCFSKMDPIAMSPGRQPHNTYIVWAKKDILPKTVMEKLPSGLNAWFYPASHDLGPNGWDALISGKKEYFQVEGDHFSIMTVPEVEQLGRILRDAIGKHN